MNLVEHNVSKLNLFQLHLKNAVPAAMLLTQVPQNTLSTASARNRRYASDHNDEACPALRVILAPAQHAGRIRMEGLD
jgi:hypothetical protein